MSAETKEGMKRGIQRFGFGRRHRKKKFEGHDFFEENNAVKMPPVSNDDLLMCSKYSDTDSKAHGNIRDGILRIASDEELRKYFTVTMVSVDGFIITHAVVKQVLRDIPRSQYILECESHGGTYYMGTLEKVLGNTHKSHIIQEIILSPKRS